MCGFARHTVVYLKDEMLIFGLESVNVNMDLEMLAILFNVK